MRLYPRLTISISSESEMESTATSGMIHIRANAIKIIWMIAEEKIFDLFASIISQTSLKV
ncbi:MAG: hypothetical protein ACUVXI_11960 [bacterium]